MDNTKLPPPYRTPRLRRLLHVHSTLWYEHVSTEITSVQYVVLWCLHHHGDQPQQELLSLAQIDKSSLAELLRRMEQQGSITTARAPDDKRRKIVSITEKGRRIHDELSSGADLVNDMMTSSLTAAELKQFDAILEKLLTSEAIRSVS